jgi:hypothetical protein
MTPTGKLSRIPARGDIADISPIRASFAPREDAYRGRTGFLEIVVENIARNPITESWMMYALSVRLIVYYVINIHINLFETHHLIIILLS